ncbi:ABC transporter substrate-binding protein [Anaeromicropila herbilytica]|uniref:Diguanylate phosphodiesterase n=1 Tax=Anaeromicropila herbilytica TaxID=2785025 RepID=A0A7R7EQ38_9FIRM|nr:ABC transporter substrate-binding protein [Anaeromicropila herbilytica]BCN32432.1 diguanylate phosphodiesterase [Anaeromicropila herbilytica]
MKKGKLKFAFLILAVFSLSIVLSACQDNMKKEKVSETPTTDANKSLEPTYGGSIVVGILQDLDSLDPHKAVAAGTKEVQFNIFEGLVKPDVDGNLVPAVASKYDISDDGKVYTFTLRDGVKFHNGKLVTVDDLIYSVKRCAGLLDKTDKSIVVEPALSNIQDVVKVDDKNIEIVLKEANTELLGYLTFAIIPKDYKDEATKPIGTGPFKFESYTPLESLVVTKNEDYYDNKKPYLDKVTFKIVANTDSAFLELKSGAIDIFPYLTDDQANQLADTFNIKTGNMNLVQALFLNNAVEPFNNPKVRQALSYAVDKKAILDMVAGGKGNTIGTNMFHAFSKYYEKSLDKVYTFDVQKAKDLLAEAGYPDGFDMTITVPSNYQYHVDTAQVLVEQLKAIGVNAKIEQVEWASWLSDVYTNRNYQSTIIGVDAKLAPRDVLERYASTASGNFINYKNPDYDKILDKAIKTTNDDEKVTLYKELETLLTNDAASVYIQDPPLLVAVNKKLGGYTFYPVYVQDMASVYFTK